MADITQIQSNVFLPMLEDTLDTLPDVLFNPGVTDIATAVNAIGDAMEVRLPMSNMDEKARASEIVRQVIETYDSLKSCPEHVGCFLPLTQLSNNLGTNMINIFNILKSSVRPEVESLKESILGKTTALLEAENLGVLVTPNAEPSTDFFIVNWDQYVNRFGGVQSIIDAFKDLTQYGSNLSITDIGIALDSAKFRIEALQINPETEDDILRRVKERTADEFQRERVDQIYRLITDPYLFNGFVVETLSRSVSSNVYPPIINACIAAIEDIYPVVNIFKSTPLDVTEDLLGRIQSNIEVLLNVFHLIAYLLLVMRKHYTEALIIDVKMINGDVLPNFESEGGSLKDVSIFLQVYYTSKQIGVPFSGIKGREVLETKQDAAALYDQLTNAHLMQASTIKNGVIIRAAREIMADHIQSADPSRLPENTSVEDFFRIKKPLIQIMLNRFDSGEDKHLENILYDFVLSLWYDGTMVQTAHELFGSEIVRQLEASSDIDNETLALVDARVAATICANFIMKEICVVKK